MINVRIVPSPKKFSLEEVYGIHPKGMSTLRDHSKSCGCGKILLGRR